jgi:NADPH2:quinone reductase
MTGETMQAWRVVRHGAPSEALELQEVPVPEPGTDEVRVRTAATVLNFNEVDGCRGRYLTVNPPLPYTLGMEVVGVVDAAGPGAEQWIGHRVMATATGAFGAHAEAVICGAEMVFDVPPGLDDRDAAAFFFPFHLAYLGLHTRGNVRPGEWVVVHAAAGGIGSAAVQLAAAAGAHVIATAGGPEKLALCRELGAEVTIDYRAGDFAPEVLEATGGRGVDVVFDTVGGEVGARSLPCLAWGGRHLVVGFSAGIEEEDEAGITPRPLCFGSISLVGVMLSYQPDGAPRPFPGINRTDRSVGDAVQRELEQLLAAGVIHPVVGREVSHLELPAALDAMEQRLTTGRTVVMW